MINKDEFDGNIVYGGSNFHKKTKRTSLIMENNFPHYEYVLEENMHYKSNMKYFESLDNCILCNSDDIEDKLYKDGLFISQCRKCSFSFQNPRFKSEYLSELYGKEYSLNGAYASEAQNKLDEIKYKYAIQELNKYSDSIESVLDIGAGNLHFLNVCKKNNIKTLYGIEPGSTLKNIDNEYNIITDFSDEVPLSINNLSVISLWDTLEHIHDFKKVIKSSYKALEDDGLILIMVPNLNSLASRLIREKSPSFCIYHLNYFTEKSLEKLLIDCGFSIMQKETVISEIDNCRNYLEFQEPYMSVPKNEKAFDWLTSEYIHDNMLGSRLFFIAKKGK